jgi:hypothetical protein
MQQGAAEEGVAVFINGRRQGDAEYVADMAEDARAGAIAAIDAVHGFEIALTGFGVAESGFQVEIRGDSGTVSDAETEGFEFGRQVR